MARKSVTVDLDSDLAAAARVIAEAQGITLREVYETALRDYFRGPVTKIARDELLRLLDEVAQTTVRREFENLGNRP
jgi:predicted transcriptional regulator